MSMLCFYEVNATLKWTKLNQKVGLVELLINIKYGSTTLVVWLQFLVW
jgi:hypothetical protein